ncbi:tubulin monoglutamylase TTLL4 [Echinops telfairi]|uniref:Tubulin monoglutamylase TTLL4 n=1 Tax=Echinops telfairi TaxID=9371 RepID=A0AC55DM76_ECHTE|nr:tubulin monoglutamylase TTLL4 [Echinops telfairi]
MASAGTEQYGIGLRRGSSFRQSDPSGTVHASPVERPSEGKVWSQAHPQVKPIWKLEKKHMGTLSTGLGPGLLGAPPQPAYFVCPSSLCSAGGTAVLAGHSSSCYLHSLPDLFSSTLLYRRSNYRHKPYQQLESFCLRSSPSEKRPFSLSQKRLPAGLTANKATLPPASPVAQPMASSPTDPYLASPGAAGENFAGKSPASAVSGKIPSPLSSSYKPVLNNNSFMRPNSTKVPLSQTPEGLKPASTPKMQVVSWHHPGGTGDCVPQPTDHKTPRRNDTVLHGAAAHATVSAPGSLETFVTSVASLQYNQNNSAMRAEPHGSGLDDEPDPQGHAKEVRLTEAVRKLTARSFRKVPRQGYQFEQSCFMNPSFQWGLLNKGPRWKPTMVGQQFPPDDAGTHNQSLPGASDTLGLDSTVFCTKRISIHLLASPANGLNHSPTYGSEEDPSPLEGGKTHVPTPSAPPLGIADVASHLSSIRLDQPRREPQEGRQLDSPARDADSATDLLTDQVEAEDVDEDLVDSLEDCCSHDENEEEEGDSECSSFSAVSPSESVAAISRNCVEILTKTLSSHEKVVRPALIYSLFPNVPPTIYFGTRDERVEKLPVEQRKLLRWKMSTVTPNIVKQTIGRSHFKISKRNDDWLGCWGHHMKSASFRTIREHQKLNHFPGSFQIGRKDRLWRNLSRMQSRFGKKEFSFFPQSFILPQDAKLLRKAWENSSRQKWIVKPPASARGIGIQVIHKWSQLPKRRPLLVQRYLHKPYLISGSKFDLRIYVYVTSYDPLRIYLFSDGLVRFASCKYSPSMKSLSNKFMHLTNYSVNKKNVEYQANADETACQGHKWYWGQDVRPTQVKAQIVLGPREVWWNDYRMDRRNNSQKTQTEKLPAAGSFLLIGPRIMASLLNLVRITEASPESGSSWKVFCLCCLWALSVHRRLWPLPSGRRSRTECLLPALTSSEPYVTSLLKMYVRRPYNCHELFGFDIMLDEKLKPWVLEVNISPSLHSNSPLDVSIKGQMIRDLLNLAGFVLPSMEDILCSPSSPSNSSTSLPSTPKDKSRMAPEHLTAQKMKKAYYLTQKIPDQDFYASVLDILTPDDVKVLVEMEDEYSRRGQFERVFPSRISTRYLRFFEQPRYFNILTTQWEQKYHSNKLKGVDLLRNWCYKGLHTGVILDSAPVWSLPPGLLMTPKGDTIPNAFCKSEIDDLGKHSSSEGNLPHSEDGASPKAKKTPASLSPFPRKPSFSKDSEDTSKEASLSIQMLPLIKCSGQTSRLSISPISQSTSDSIFAAVSP